MKFFVLVFLLGCSASTPMKYSYKFTKRKPAEMVSQNINIARIEARLKKASLFASGMDSTYLIVRLFDREGQLVTDIDPNDLSLLSNEDIKAKPFVLKQGLFKAEILPNVKSKNIHLRVVWKDFLMSPKVLLQTITAPMKDELVPLNHDYFQTKVFGEVTVNRGSASEETFTEGFSFENIGKNKIVRSSQRAFTFNYLEQARQNLSLLVEDDSPSRHSLFMFFPRNQLPLVEQLSGTIDVTLPNGEKLIFQKESKEIVDGVFREGPVKEVRKKGRPEFPDLKYLGQGIVLRANGLEGPPEIEDSKDPLIDLVDGGKGSRGVLIIDGKTGKRCRRPKKDFWGALNVSPIEFKFPRDEEFYEYLKKKCGFSLSKL